MAVRKRARPEKAALDRSTRERASDVWMRRGSAIAGGLLICAALAWFGWLLLRQQNPGLAIRFPFAPAQPTAQPAIDPLVSVGITLSAPSPGQTALLTQPQALVLANQLEPQAAAHADSVSAEYTLFSYKGSSTTTAALHNVPAWLVHYTHVAAAAADTAADPHARNVSHDCYLFLDANSGQELLALWV